MLRGRSSVSIAAAKFASTGLALTRVSIASPTESPRRLVEGGHPRLSRSGDINEDCNKDEERIAEEAKKAKHKCQGLSDGGGNLRRSGFPEFHGEDRVQDAAAVHRESGDHVEEDQEDVGGGEPSKKRDAWIFDPCQIVGLDRSEDEEAGR